MKSLWISTSCLLLCVACASPYTFHFKTLDPAASTRLLVLRIDKGCPDTLGRALHQALLDYQIPNTFDSVILRNTAHTANPAPLFLQAGFDGMLRLRCDTDTSMTLQLFQLAPRHLLWEAKVALQTSRIEDAVDALYDAVEHLVDSRMVQPRQAEQ